MFTFRHTIFNSDRNQEQGNGMKDLWVGLLRLSGDLLYNVGHGSHFGCCFLKVVF